MTTNYMISFSLETNIGQEALVKTIASSLLMKDLDIKEIHMFNGIIIMTYDIKAMRKLHT